MWCTDGFRHDEVSTLSRYLSSVWSVESRLKPIPDRPDQTRLHLDRQNLARVLDIVSGHIPVAGMLYKVMPCLGEFELQQRWISKLYHASTVPELRRHLTTCYAEPLRQYTPDQDFTGFYLRLRDAARDAARSAEPEYVINRE